MKKLAAAILIGGICAAATAADIDGIYNTWSGYLAGHNSDGYRNTLIGAGAGGESNYIDDNVFIGAGAGAKSTNVVACVGIGFGALARSRDMFRTTWINGQFYASYTNNEFYISARPVNSIMDAPIYLFGDTLHLGDTLQVSIGGHSLDAAISEALATRLPPQEVWDEFDQLKIAVSNLEATVFSLTNNVSH